MPKIIPVSTSDEKQEDSCWLKIKDAAELKRVHPNTIRNLISRGQLKAYRLGARIIRIDSKDLDNVFTEYEGGAFGIWQR